MYSNNTIKMPLVSGLLMFSAAFICYCVFVAHFAFTAYKMFEAGNIILCVICALFIPIVTYVFFKEFFLRIDFWSGSFKKWRVQKFLEFCDNHAQFNHRWIDWSDKEQARWQIVYHSEFSSWIVNPVIDRKDANHLPIFNNFEDCFQFYIDNKDVLDAILTMKRKLNNGFKYS